MLRRIVRPFPNCKYHIFLLAAGPPMMVTAIKDVLTGAEVNEDDIPAEDFGSYRKSPCGASLEPVDQDGQRHSAVNSPAGTVLSQYSAFVKFERAGRQ